MITWTFSIGDKVRRKSSGRAGTVDSMGRSTEGVETAIVVWGNGDRERCDVRTLVRATPKGARDVRQEPAKTIQSMPVIITVTRNENGTVNMLSSCDGVVNPWTLAERIDPDHEFEIIGNLVKNLRRNGFPWVQVEFGKQDVEVPA